MGWKVLAWKPRNDLVNRQSSGVERHDAGQYSTSPTGVPRCGHLELHRLRGGIAPRGREDELEKNGKCPSDGLKFI